MFVVLDNLFLKFKTLKTYMNTQCNVTNLETLMRISFLLLFSVTFMKTIHGMISTSTYCYLLLYKKPILYHRLEYSPKNSTYRSISPARGEVFLWTQSQWVFSLCSQKTTIHKKGILHRIKRN